MPQANNQNLIKWADSQCPPFLAMFFARCGANDDGVRLTRADVAKSGGLSVRTVDRLAIGVSWRGIKFDVASNYLAGCKVDLFKMERWNAFLASEIKQETPLAHIPERSRKRILKRFADLCRKRSKNGN